MKSLDENLLSDPSDTANKPFLPVPLPQLAKYGYVATHSDGTTACTTGDARVLSTS